jgi:urease accessory protein
MSTWMPMASRWSIPTTTHMSAATRIEVHRREGRLTCTFRGGHLVARRIDAPDGMVRVALVATVALLLAGDDVRIEVVVGAGVDLEIVEIAGTVAYDMRGGCASWHVDVHVEDGGILTWEGLPFVLSDGSDVARSMNVTLDCSGRVALRETYVFGRSGELGGDLRASTLAHVDGRPLLVEDLDLRTARRVEPAVMGAARCLDAVTILGARIDTEGPGILQLDRPGSIDRRLVTSLHDSDLSRSFQDAAEATRRPGMASRRSRLEPESPSPTPAR